MEQDPEAKDREPEGVKADANLAGELENPEKIPVRDWKPAKTEDRAEVKIPDKGEIRAVSKNNKISKT
jgi:hypothetical protein